MHPLIGADDIQNRVLAMAFEIAHDHPRGVHLVCVLKGAFVFLADLARALRCDVTVDFIALSSYGAATTSSGQVQLLKDLDSPIEGRDVVIVEDIVDTGLTLAYLQEILRARAPRSLKTACLVSKPSRRQVSVPVEYVGFEIDDSFVVGYGLDEGGRYRNLPFIAALRAGGRDPNAECRMPTLRPFERLRVVPSNVEGRMLNPEWRIPMQTLRSMPRARSNR